MIECEHCHMDTAIRNPSGYCDHLYYPEYCEKCRLRKQKMSKSAVINQTLLSACKLAIVQVDAITAQVLEDAINKAEEK